MRKGETDMCGHILVITGGMFSGKSELLIERCLKFEKYGHKTVKVYKPVIDDRFAEDEVVSRTGYRFPATNIPEKLNDEIVEQIFRETENVDIVGFDEAQFFSKPIMYVVGELAYRGKYVMVAGLNMDYRGKEFGYMGGLLAQADEIIRLYSFCAVCGNPKGTHTQRLINGKPAEKGSPIVMIGDMESYEPRCRNCFVPPERA
jgi:thymidine kinase